MSEHPNVGRIRGFYKAEATGDADTIGELLADDLVIPGRHRFSGNHDKAEILAIQREALPELSETGHAVISTFNIELEGVVHPQPRAC